MMMMKPHETKIPNTMAKVFGFGPLLFPVSENCENVQSDGQDTITFVFTSLSPSSHFAPPPCPSVVATKTPTSSTIPNDVLLLLLLFLSIVWRGTQPITKMSHSSSPRSRSCCVLERVFQSMYKFSILTARQDNRLKRGTRVCV